MIYKHKLTGNFFSIKEVKETIGTYYCLDDNFEKIYEKSAFGPVPKVAICKTENMTVYENQKLTLF